jgi:predicted XRE-type DNA-binding protein
MPEDVKDVFGSALLDAQSGDVPDGARPFGEGLPRQIMKLVEDHDGETYRAAYTVAFEGAVHVLDVPEEVEDGGPYPEAGKEQGPRPLQGGGRGSRAATIRRSDMSDDVKVHESSGNVFQDLDARQAEERLAKAELARVIRREIRGRKLTQTQAAELLGITQPDVSDLVRGKLGRFSMERLERFLNALDMEVRIQVGPKPKDKDRAGISVELVGSF